jgi:quercetin dioxygenase-like cupin family protein
MKQTLIPLAVISALLLPLPAASQVQAPGDRPLVLRQAELMGSKPVIHVPGEVRVWNMRRDTHSRTNLVEFSGRSPLHTHPDAAHTLLVMSGSVWVRAGSEELKLQTGDYISIPPDVPHAYWVEPGTKALLVSFDAPAYDEKKTVWLEPQRR